MMGWLPWRRAPLGRRGEAIAARFLRRHGMKILGRNVVFGRYELDLVARERDTVAFVEVKTRRKSEHIQPEDSVGSVKRRHIRAAAHRYIEQRGEPGLYYRFDVISVLLPERGKPEVTHYPDAFPDE